MAQLAPHNWNQYTSEVDSIEIKLNNGKHTTIKFIPAVERDDPFKCCNLTSACNDAARNIEQTLGMRIGRLELSTKAESVVYPPLSKTVTKYTGRVAVDNIRKIYASLPVRIGEFKFLDPRAAEYMYMPRSFTRSIDCYHHITITIK